MSTQAVSLAASAARTSSGNGAAVDCGGASQINTLRLTLDVTANSETGTSPYDSNVARNEGPRPTFRLALEHSPDNATWREHSRLSTTPDVHSERHVLTGFDRYVRAAWKVEGEAGASVTFALTGDGA